MQKFTFIYTPTIDYEFMQQRPQRLMEQFARAGHQVYYINMNQTGEPPKVVEPNLTVLHSYSQIFLMKKDYPVVLWMSWAKTHDWIEKINPYISVYDCLDDFSDWREFEKVIVNKVDFITTTAEHLYNKMSSLHKNVVMVKNACEYEKFENIDLASKPKDWPSNFDKSVVGYVGALGHWINSQLILKIAQDHKVVLIGPEFGMKKISHPNIAKLGMKKYKDLPGYIKMMDALIIPFSLNDITKSTNPIKMYEYLATGKPVISSTLPETILYSEVYNANTDEGFISMLDRALSGEFNTSDLIEKRKLIASNNSWKNRYETIYKKLLEVNKMKNKINIEEVKNEDITVIYPPGFDYNFMYQRPHQMSKSFAKLGVNVLYINPASIVDQKEDIVIPFKDLPNLKVIKTNVNWKRLKKGKVAVVCPVTMEHSLTEYAHDLSILDSCDLAEDEFSNHKNMLLNIEKNVDLVVSTAEAIFEDHKSRGVDSVLSSNGADYDHFSIAKNKIGTNPFEFSENKPIVGFYGALHTWIDYDFILEISKKYNVVLIGKSEYFETKNISSQNIITLPVQNYKSLPHYLSWFDVAFLPFKLSKMMSGTNPVKFFEYLSAAKPVISTKLKELEQYSDVCYLTDIENVNSTIEKALNENSIEKENSRQEVARKNSWDIKTSIVLEAMKLKLMESDNDE